MKARDILKRLKNGESINITHGMPPHEFYPAAWGDEPLTTQALVDADIMYTLPFGDAERSLVAKDRSGNVIGQCSTNDVVTYWNHVNSRDTSDKNAATKSFVEIHQLAAKTEAEFADKLHLNAEASAHNAGIAVLPKSRRKKVATILTEQQIAECTETGKQALFAETTNHKSAGIMKSLNFFPIAAFAYKDLAKEMGNEALTKMEDDSFSVWCRKL